MLTLSRAAASRTFSPLAMSSRARCGDNRLASTLESACRTNSTMKSNSDKSDRLSFGFNGVHFNLCWAPLLDSPLFPWLPMPNPGRYPVAMCVSEFRTPLPYGCGDFFACWIAVGPKGKLQSRNLGEVPHGRRQQTVSSDTSRKAC